MGKDPLIKDAFREWIDFEENPYHPFVWIRSDPDIGEDVYLGFFNVVNAKDSPIIIRDGCDISPMVSVNCADSHRKCLGFTDEVDREPIELAENVFVGTNAVIKPGGIVGHHSVIGAGETVSGEVPPYSLVVDGTVKQGYYKIDVQDAQ